MSTKVNVYFNGSLTEPIRIPCPLVEVTVNDYGQPVGKIESPFGHGGLLRVEYDRYRWCCDVD
tara:strand:+ start:1247 stop:1435 length:189 start_codon:yes stop_codon:yes gene_type:complete